MSWWDDILSDIADWGSDVWDSLAGFTDEVAKGYAWIGEGIGTLARAFYDAVIAYGEKIWDAFYNGFSFVRNGLMDLGNGIWVGLTRLGEYLKLGLDALWGALSWIGTQIFSFGKWLWAGISWIGSQLYNFGSWLWDALTWLGETVWDGLKWVGGNLWAGLKAFGQWTWSGVCWLGAQTAKLTKWMWDSITGFFKNLYDTVRTWMGSLTTGVNSWMSGLLGNYKDKIDDILFANMMVLGSKNIITNLTEKAGDAKSLGEVGYHVLGSVGSGVALPIVGWIMKEVLAMTVKGVGGTDVKLFPPESDGLKYMPEFAYTSEDVPVEDRDPYRETTPQFDSGFTPGIVHAKPEAGTPPGTPVCGECPPSELFMPPDTPTPPVPPYTPPPPEEPIPSEPPFAKSISIDITGGVPSPVVIPEAYYEIPVTVGGGSPSPGFIGLSEVGVEVGGGVPSVELELPEAYIYVGGTGAANIKKYNRSDLLFVAESVYYGGNINAVASDAEYVYVGGDITNKVRKYRKSDLVFVAETVSYGGSILSIAEDTEYLYVGGDTILKVRKYRKSDMAYISESPLCTYPCNAVTVDAEFLYATDYSMIKKFRKSDMTYVSESPYYGVYPIHTLANDADYVYAGGSGDATTMKVHKHRKSDMALVAESILYGYIIFDILVDGEYLFVAGDLPYRVNKHRTSDLAIIATSPDFGAEVDAIGQDDEYIYAGGALQIVKKYRKSDLGYLIQSLDYGGQIYEIE